MRSLLSSIELRIHAVTLFCAMLMGSAVGISAETLSSWSQTTALSQSGDLQKAIFIDYNLDSYPDMIVVNNAVNPAAQVVGYANNGDGTFAAAASFMMGSRNVNALATGDFNHNGRPDLVIAWDRANLASSIMIYYDLATPPVNGGQAFVDPQPQQGDPAAPLVRDLAVGDFNGDGWDDIVMVSDVDWKVQIFTNQKGAIPNSFTRTSLSSIPTPSTVCTGDIDGDGRTDVVVGTSSLIAAFQPLFFYRNSGSTNPNVPGLYNSTPIASPFRVISDVVLTDLDFDGRDDLVVAATNPSGQVLTFRNTSTWAIGNTTISWGAPVASPLTDAKTLAAGDLDRDGDIDIVAGSRTGNLVRWYQNRWNQDKTFGFFTGNDALFKIRNTAYTHEGLAIADLNQDGDLDVVEAGKPSSGDPTVSTVSTFANPFPSFVATPTPTP